MGLALSRSGGMAARPTELTGCIFLGGGMKIIRTHRCWTFCALVILLGALGREASAATVQAAASDSGRQAGAALAESNDGDQPVARVAMADAPGAAPAGPAAKDAGTIAGNGQLTSPNDRSSRPSLEELASLLADAPNMYGDFFASGGTLLADDGVVAIANLPLAGGAGRLSVADNNKPLPQDRVYALYNHFQNAMVADASNFFVGPDRRMYSVDRYTLGFEKSLREGLWSVEMRLPLTGQYAFDTPNFGVSGGSTGDLAVVVKRVVYKAERMVVAAGMGVDTPTGSVVEGQVNGIGYRVRNQSVSLVPYAGVLAAPTDQFFWQGFLQVDVPCGVNPVDVEDMMGNRVEVGNFTNQTLLHADLQAGYWLYRNRAARVLTGVASVLELHYTSTLTSARELSGGVMGTLFDFGNQANRMDVVDLTVGIHSELARNTLLRVGAAFPLQSANRTVLVQSQISGLTMPVLTTGNRTFDSELQVQLERRF
jgi:hypothetical protein